MPIRRSTSTTSVHEAKSGLSTGAIAGIITSVVLGVLISIAFGTMDLCAVEKSNNFFRQHF
jgi:hypothetical protein